ncbi:hypothetical protein E2C01_098679 [Portunus trituberculatus]|uniref:Uncharacterized protein n=1 Tax=Portunus trituberculatus TaxID=210409 RepID=A0A5B7K1U2_PORTR|nr:hypothetical protein [Portunus trituberculatus]
MPVDAAPNLNQFRKLGAEHLCLGRTYLPLYSSMERKPNGPDVHASAVPKILIQDERCAAPRQHGRVDSAHQTRTTRGRRMVRVSGELGPQNYHACAAHRQR